MLKSTECSVNSFDFHLEKHGPHCSKNLIEFSRMHSSWPEDDRDELEQTVGNKKVVKIFNQNYVICVERDSDYIFKQCGHQCIGNHS